MPIRIAKPVGGRRELLCKGDEATVSRIRGVRDYEGMVERLQHIPSQEEADSTFQFGIYTTRQDEKYLSYSVSIANASYHLLKFVSLRFAKAIFQDNFVNCHEIRFFKEAGQRYTVTYSDFVPDDNGLVQRRKRHMEAFYAEEDTEKRESMRERADEEERRMNPSLVQTVRDLREVGGIILAHPEANYHLSDGSLVFFEIAGLNIWDASAFSYSDRIQEYLSLFYAIALRQTALHILKYNDNVIMQQKASGFADCALDELVRIAHFIVYVDKDLGNEKPGLREVGRPIKNGIHYYRPVKDLLGEMSVDQGAIKDIDRIMRDDF